jgi:hypothetical protein
MDGIYLIFCLAIVVFLAFVALVIVILKSGSKEESQPIRAPAGIVMNETKNQTPQHNPQKTVVADGLRTEEQKERSRKRQNTGWQRPFAFIGISLVIALWTIWGALFFLAVVWIMGQNPRADSSFTITENEKKSTRGIYVWLLLSPILILPVFVGLLLNLDFPEADTNTRALITMIPLIFHLLLATGLTSKSAFVYRHTQQAILLIALRAGLAALAISVGSYPIDGIWLFLLGNGSLWLLGSLWGLDQVSRGECWWMEQKGQRLIMKNERAADLSPEIHLERSREFIERYNAAEAKKHALAAFRGGDRAIRLQAVKLLSALHEVEEF